MICPRQMWRWVTQKIEHKWGWNFTYKVSQYHDSYTLYISFIYLTLYIPLPNFGYHSDNWDRAWGVYWFGSTIWFQWDKHTKGFDMPWSWKHVRHQVMYPDGLKYPPENSWEWDDGRLVEIHPYKYTLKSGKVQERIATICIEEREWRWKLFTWLPWPRRICRTISVDFSDEVGERSGSWKGGTLGCGYDMKPGETMAETLKRMELERTFD